MSSTEDHRQKAEHNESLVTTLQNPFWDWGVTASFYSAVHYVEAYFAKRKPSLHSASHQIRDSAIQRDEVLQPLYRAYRDLKGQSINARYEAHIPFAKSDVQDAQMNLSKLKAVLLPLLR